MAVSSGNKIAVDKIATCYLLMGIITFIASFHGAVAFVPVRRHTSSNKRISSSNKSINRIIISPIIQYSTSSSYEYLPPNPDSPPGVFHIPTLKSWNIPQFRKLNLGLANNTLTGKIKKIRGVRRNST